jgi:hypothetical protein
MFFYVVDFFWLGWLAVGMLTACNKTFFSVSPMYMFIFFITTQVCFVSLLMMSILFCFRVLPPYSMMYLFMTYVISKTLKTVASILFFLASF